MHGEPRTTERVVVVRACGAARGACETGVGVGARARVEVGAGEPWTRYSRACAP